MQRNPAAIFLMGPTAAGKTALAIELTRYLPCDIISVDSAMVYRGMDIGTAKPSRALRKAVPHRLIDIRDPGDPYSAAQFRTDALREIAGILAQQRIPLLVGGTGLYFRALEHGLSDLPAAHPEVRARLEAEAAVHGWAALHARLAEIDPEAAARISPGDPQRVQRALEVYELTGTPLSALQVHRKAEPLPLRVVKIIVSVDNREELEQRIHRRFFQMLAQGFVEEVETLFRRGDLNPQLPALRAVGYRQIWEYLAGERGYAKTVDRAIIATRQYAKRQMTWLRGETGIHRLSATDPELLIKALKTLKDAAI